MYNLQGDKIDRRVCITCLGLGIFLLQQAFFFVLDFADCFFLTACLKLYSTHTFTLSVSLSLLWVTLRFFSVGYWSGVTKDCGNENLKLYSGFLWGCLHFLELLGFGFLVVFMCFFTQVCFFISNEIISKVVKYRIKNFVCNQYMKGWDDWYIFQ